MKFIVVFLSLISTAAFAQQATPSEQALSARLLQELQASVNCSTEAIALKTELAKAQARIKELEPKVEPKVEK